MNNGKRFCQRERGKLPCLADIYVLAGLDDACEVCAEGLPRIRTVFPRWHPVGQFYRCPDLHPSQVLVIDNEIAKRQQAVAMQK